MKKLLSAAAACLSLGTVLVSNSSIAQDGWYLSPNTPTTEQIARETCTDTVPPTCAYLIQNGQVAEVLDFSAAQ